MTKELLHKIKEFAKVNDILEDEEIKVTAEHPYTYMAVTNPWMDESDRFELKNSEAVKRWGLSTVVDFCEKVTDLMKNNPNYVDIMLGFYDLPADGFDAIRDMAEEHHTTLERVAFNYTKAVNTTCDAVRLLIDNENPSIGDAREAFEAMEKAIR